MGIMFSQQIKIAAINPSFGRVTAALLWGLALGLGVTLWLGTEGGWHWWTAWLPGWLLSLAAMILVLLVAAPDDGVRLGRTIQVSRMRCRSG